MIRFVIFFIFSLITESFFGLVSWPRYIFFVFLFLGTIWYKPGTRFSTPILLFVISLVVSMFACVEFHGQSFMNMLDPYNVYIPITVYFALTKLDFPVEDVERTVFILFLLFCLCYLYQVSVFPNEVFISLEDDPTDDEFESTTEYRIRMIGMSLAALGYFYSLNKVLLKKYQYVFPMVLGMVVVMFFGFRTLMFFSFIFTIVMIIRVKKLSRNTVFYLAGLGLILLGLLFFTGFGENVMKGLLERQNDGQTFSNKDYIRWATLYYYLTEHFQNFLEFITGSGLPNYSIQNSYTGYYDYLEKSLGLHYYDWGILGVSWMTGFFSLVAMLWYAIKATFTRLPKRYVYASVWFTYILFCGFTSAEFVRQGNFYIQGLILYIISSTALAKGETDSEEEEEDDDESKLLEDETNSDGEQRPFTHAGY